MTGLCAARLFGRIFSLSLFILTPFAAIAAPGDSMQISGTADVEVVETSQIQAVEDLRFGTMARPTTAGTVSVNQNGNVTSTLDISQFPGGRAPATFLVRGDPSRFFVVFLPGTISISNGSSNMTVDQFNANTFFGFAFMNATGEFDLRVGGRLNISANQPVGSYSGTFDVTVLYL